MSGLRSHREDVEGFKGCEGESWLRTVLRAKGGRESSRLLRAWGRCDRPEGTGPHCSSRPAGCRRSRTGSHKRAAPCEEPLQSITAEDLRGERPSIERPAAGATSVTPAARPLSAQTISEPAANRRSFLRRNDRRFAARIALALIRFPSSLCYRRSESWCDDNSLASELLKICFMVRTNLS